MTTKVVSKNGRLDDDSYGWFNRRIDDLKRRVDENSLGFFWVMDRLQEIIEGRGEFDDLSCTKVTMSPVEQRDLSLNSLVCELKKRTNHFHEQGIREWAAETDIRGRVSKYYIVSSQTDWVDRRSSVSGVSLIKAIKRFGGDLCSVSDVLYLADTLQDRSIGTNFYIPLTDEADDRNRFTCLKVKHHAFVSVQITCSREELFESFENVIFRIPVDHPAVERFYPRTTK